MRQILHISKHVFPETKRGNETHLIVKEDWIYFNVDCKRSDKKDLSESFQNHKRLKDHPLFPISSLTTKQRKHTQLNTNTAQISKNSPLMSRRSYLSSMPTTPTLYATCCAFDFQIAILTYLFIFFFCAFTVITFESHNKVVVGAAIHDDHMPLYKPSSL